MTKLFACTNKIIDVYKQNYLHVNNMCKCVHVIILYYMHVNNFVLHAHLHMCKQAGRASRWRLRNGMPPGASVYSCAFFFLFFFTCTPSFIGMLHCIVSMLSQCCFVCALFWFLFFLHLYPKAPGFVIMLYYIVIILHRNGMPSGASVYSCAHFSFFFFIPLARRRSLLLHL